MAKEHDRTAGGPADAWAVTASFPEGPSTLGIFLSEEIALYMADNINPPRASSVQVVPVRGEFWCHCVTCCAFANDSLGVIKSALHLKPESEWS